MLRTLILSVLVVAAASSLASTSAAARAKVWLRQHQAPDEAGLEDLKNSDPNSYAIVQALLMKQQAGLLDPANPAGTRHEEHQSAADIMRSAPSIEGASESISEVAISAPVKHAVFTHGNPWAYKAKDDDEAMVNNVLGAVSELKPSPASSSLISSRRSSSDASASSLNADMDLMNMVGSGSDLGASAQRTQQSQGNFYGIKMGWGEKPAPAAMSQQNSYVSHAPVAPAVNRANPYLEGIDLNNQAAPAPRAPEASMIKQNSYLSGINFPGHQEAASAPVSKSDSSLLSSFSWNEYADVASGKVQVRAAPVETQYIQRVEDKFDQSKLKGSLSDWLKADAAPAPKKAMVQVQNSDEESQPGEKVDPMAIDNYNNWAHGNNFQ